jgi:phosphoglycolate phosphatase
MVEICPCSPDGVGGCLVFDAVLFDLDGTLWDATPVMVEVWAELLARRSDIVRPPVTAREIRSNMGLLIDHIGRRMFPSLTEEDRAAVMEEFNTLDTERLARRGGALFPGMEETLAALAARYKLFIVSNCQDGYIEGFYSGNGLRRFFSGEECAGRTGLPKGENIKLVVERYGLKNPVYIGDTAMDCAAADEAAVPFLHAAYGFGQVECEHAVTCFSAIPAALEAMSPP